MPDKPLLTVVIATYNRCDTLRITLEKISFQKLPPARFEVIVVDDGSADGTSDMVKSLISAVPYRLKFFQHENQGPGYTQNRGIKEANSSLIVLMADDIWATPEFLENHLKTHNELPQDNIAVLGKVLQSPELPPTVIHKYWDPFRFDRFEGQRELNSINFLACNISVKKDFLLKNGMYLELKGAANEDIELGYRLGLKGLRIIFNRHALAYHYHVETIGNACKRWLERGRNFDVLSDNIPKPFIFSLYNLCSLEAGVKAFVKMLPREVPRAILFNKWSTRNFWVPILESAESKRFAALFANQITYRGTIHYYLREGYRLKKNEMYRLKRA